MSTLSREAFLAALVPWFPQPTVGLSSHALADLFQHFVEDEVSRLLAQPEHLGTNREKLLETVHAVFPPLSVQEGFYIWKEAEWAEKELDEILRARVWAEVRRLKEDLSKSELTELVHQRFSGKCLNDALWEVGSLFSTRDDGGC